MRDQRFPPYWRRAVFVLYRPTAMPEFPYLVWCGEHHAVVNDYDTPTTAAIAAHRHLDHGGHRTMPDTNRVPSTHGDPQSIAPAGPALTLLIDYIDRMTATTEIFDVRAVSVGDDVVTTYKVRDDNAAPFGYRYAAIALDADTRTEYVRLIEGDAGLSDQEKSDANQSRGAER